MPRSCDKYLDIVTNDFDMSGLQQPDEHLTARLPKRILLVDDDDLELELMAGCLRADESWLRQAEAAVRVPPPPTAQLRPGETG